MEHKQPRFQQPNSAQRHRPANTDRQVRTEAKSGIYDCYISLLKHVIAMNAWRTVIRSFIFRRFQDVQRIYQDGHMRIIYN